MWTVLLFFSSLPFDVLYLFVDAVHFLDGWEISNVAVRSSIGSILQKKYIKKCTCKIQKERQKMQ